jgi:ubiquinone/menaquinone biosynthesis C-methylase UbiE
VKGDARDLKFPDASFDVVFSNSVIEHVGELPDQCKMAEEVKRVGKRYFVQTPNKFFFIEPHFLFPCFQFLPINVRAWLAMNFKLGWFSRQSSFAQAKYLVESIKLFSRSELLALFPESNLYEEKILGMVKSFIVYSGWD